MTPLCPFCNQPAKDIGLGHRPDYVHPRYPACPAWTLSWAQIETLRNYIVNLERGAHTTVKRLVEDERKKRRREREKRTRSRRRQPTSQPANRGTQ